MIKKQNRKATGNIKIANVKNGQTALNTCSKYLHYKDTFSEILVELSLCRSICEFFSDISTFFLVAQPLLTVLEPKCMIFFLLSYLGILVWMFELFACFNAKDSFTFHFVSLFSNNQIKLKLNSQSKRVWNFLSPSGSLGVFFLMTEKLRQDYISIAVLGGVFPLSPHHFFSFASKDEDLINSCETESQMVEC